MRQTRDRDRVLPLLWDGLCLRVAIAAARGRLFATCLRMHEQCFGRVAYALERGAGRYLMARTCTLTMASQCPALMRGFFCFWSAWTAASLHLPNRACWWSLGTVCFPSVFRLMR